MTTTHWWSAAMRCDACHGGSSGRIGLWPGSARRTHADLSNGDGLPRQFVLQRHFAQALDRADSGAARRHELAGDHAAGRDDHALLQGLAMLAELVGEPGQRIVAMAEHVARVAGAHDLAVEG